jgi:hypothetical protein
VKKAKNTIVRALSAVALYASLVAAPAFSEDMTTTAEIAGMAAEPLAAGEHLYQTSRPELDLILAPLTQLQSSLNANSTTMITQIGDTNFAHAGVQGAGNLAIIAQSGSNNRAVQAIQGNNSAMLLVQSGSGNNVLQASTGNNNTQLLGVSGTSNDVAYLQVGNGLAGAMDVGGENSAVFALQTPKSGNYLMPSGLTGLKDQVVIVVPGRMYVFNRNQF